MIVRFRPQPFPHTLLSVNRLAALFPAARNFSSAKDLRIIRKYDIMQRATVDIPMKLYTFTGV